MDTNIQNNQTNTFEKGMNLDIQDLLMPNNLYREAYNLRFIPDVNGEGGQLKIIEGGNVVMFDFGQNVYKPLMEDDSHNVMKVIKVTKCRNLLILITENALKLWYVYTIETDGTDLQTPTKSWHLCFGPCLTPLGDTISVVTRYESDSVIKLYIADNTSPLKIINVKQDYQTSDINQILSDNNGLLNPIEIIGYINGSIVAESVQYIYYCYNKYTTTSNLSPITQLIPIGNGLSGNLLAGIDYNNINSKGIKLYIESNTNFDKIKIFRISYKQTIYSPEVDLIYDDKQSSDGYYEDIGKSDQKLTLEELFANEYSIIPKIIESKDNRLFAANLNNLYWPESSEISKADFDSWDVTAFTEEMEANLDFNDPWDKNVWEHGYTSSVQSTVPTMQWNFVVLYRTLDTYDTTDPYVRKYNNEWANIDTYNKLKSLRRGEIYRYGIVLYDATGKKYPVKWIADIRTPDLLYNSLYAPTGYSCPNTKRHDEWRANILGIRFLIKNFPAGTAAYEIVRCNRTLEYQHNISQGVISFLLIPLDYGDEDYDDKYVCGSPYVSTDLIEIWRDDDKYSVNSLLEHSKIKHIQYFSPEISYQGDDIMNIMKLQSNIKLTPAYYLESPGGIYEGIFKDVPHEWFFVGDNFYGDFQTLVDLSSGNSYFKDPGTSKTAEFTYSFRKAQNQSMSFKMYHPSTLDESNESQSIQEQVIPNTQSPEDFEGLSENILILDQFTMLSDGYKYIHWNIPHTIGLSEEDFKEIPVLYIGLASKCAILKVDNILKLHQPVQQLQNYFKTTVCNIQKQVDSIYGGVSTESRNSSEYKSHGMFFTVTNPNLGANVDVYDGDTFINIFEFLSQHTYLARTKLDFGIKGAMLYFVPVETSIDIDHDYGARISREALKNINSNDSLLGLGQLLPWSANVSIGTTTTNELGNTVGDVRKTNFVQSKPMFAYNVGYSAEGVSTPITTVSDIETLINEDCRVTYSELKNNLETEDSWVKFKPINYLDVDNRYGEITNLMTFANKLFFWQDRSFGVLSVNERAQITNGDGRSLILGTGGVLERFDYFSTESGMKYGDFSADHSDSAIYWIDRNSKDLYRFQQNVSSMSKKYSILMLTNSKSWNNKPTVCFDKRYDEILFNAFVGEKSTIVFNELMNAFQSFYNIDFDHSVRVNKLLLLVNNNFIYKWDEITGNTSKYHAHVDNQSGNCVQDELKPYIKFIVNQNPQYSKVYDNMTLEGSFYDSNEKYASVGGSDNGINYYNFSDLSDGSYSHMSPSIKFEFSTPLYQRAKTTGLSVTNREWIYKLTIPRNSNEYDLVDWGNRLRGKKMICEIKSDSSNLDFALCYISTKFRVSWT